MNESPTVLSSSNSCPVNFEFDYLSKEIATWRKETFFYRWLNILLFWACKVVVPAGALLVAINMVSELVGDGLINTKHASVIAIIVTVMASLEALLNPAAKKRLAFTLNNNLRALEIKINICKNTMCEEEFIKELNKANEHFRDLLNHYSENGY
ncbi:hypothetical protein [Desulfovibrio sp. JC022]|uniref:hypothetical protein n=1 Tax=Desulfovibrio sp. JC022 TaxID=2593642 RepID=UPI0013D6FD69|nr:hypothetical protein [Desulfovibrio sp. JC022]NDV24038.1 hypothetical protein [Desulfovibrio sp. JC022]